ncbi:MAG TPA: peptidyl-prolyl cis-trans isomerase [Solirubrobacteraceae bacterium]|nr:peptidyl-prolyl cis-trans isomerase [Solirubrobacteraceae bacterium]
MRSPSRCIAALCAVLFALVGIAACGGGIPSDSVVAVSGKPITKSTFNHWMGVAAAASSSSEGTVSKPVIPEPPNYAACIAHLEATQPKPAKGAAAQTHAQLKSQCETQYKSLQQEVLGFLISSQWVLGEGESLGVKVSDSEVKKRFTQIKEQQFPKAAEFEKFLASSGQSVSDLLLRVKLNLLSSKIQQKIIKSKSNPSEAQVAKYYNEHKSRFEVPEKRAVNIILTKTAAEAAKAKAEVSSGKSFASVAKSASIDPVSKARGGLLPEVVKGQEEQALSNAIFAAKPNVLSGPVKTPFGYYVYEVKSVTPGNVQSLAQAKASVKSQLVATNQQAALSAFVKNFKSKWMSKTECLSHYNGVALASAIQDCKEYKAAKAGGLK